MELGRGSFIERVKKKDTEQEDCLMQFSQWEMPKETSDVNCPGEEE